MSPTHWLVAAGVFVLLFGSGRLPDAARSLGRSIRILRAETATPGASGGDHPWSDGAGGPPPPGTGSTPTGS